MSLLSICMPSNRNLAASRKSIEAALAFAEARDAQLIVADNSEDAEKAAWWQGRSDRLHMLDTRGKAVFDNYLATIMAAQTPFILQLGDDDMIGIDASVPSFDLATLPDDFMGVRPRTELTVTGQGVVRSKTFSIDSPTPSGRIREYSEKAKGDNSAFYSIFRREPYLGLMRLFGNHHPIKGGFADWAMALALFAYGRMAYDPSIIYQYNADQWSTPEKTAARNLQLFQDVGMPPHTTLFQPLLMTLDVFTFVARPGTPLSREEALDAMSVIGGEMLNGFLNQVVRQPKDYSEKIGYLAELARAETDAFARFQLALIMVDDLKPGLKDAYVRFYQMANTAG
ncbi:hypothetical protein [Gellertiella hungarica]|uniref:Uncharacterized protein n=1 Tax=Gellertiella hungarica TaxID=1572859 RepID=A0A7W6J8V7_9HYPH|nr:hypothetical protein [Gellertiella hungarica]MBB4066930.1 hypothetical protein [Gellertiella hungarica]